MLQRLSPPPAAAWNIKTAPFPQDAIFSAVSFFSCAVSILFGLFSYHFADTISVTLLGEARCTLLIQILSFSFLPAGIHACINGYYLGKKRTVIPAFSQLVEQIARIGSVSLFYLIVLDEGHTLYVSHAVWGIVISEFAGMLFCITALSLSQQPISGKNSGFSFLPTRSKKGSPYLASLFFKLRCSLGAIRQIWSMAYPLALNHVLIDLFSGIENVLIPQKLAAYGFSNADSLAIYGIFTGITMPILLFPEVLTNSAAVLLLPEISSAKADQQLAHIDRLTKKAIRCGLLFGFLFTFLFFISADFLGTTIFHSPLSTEFLKQLCWLCPFLYISSLLCSILHGLGHPKTVLFINLLASLIRILMILMLVPAYGIRAYLWGMLLAQAFTTIALIWMLSRQSL